MTVLVLSLFPGIGLLDMAFEAEGFVVVRGPDPLWGGDVRKFRPPAGRFDGVIGGPPCQTFSILRRLMKTTNLEPKFGNLIPEFERVVSEAAPSWFVMENVVDAPEPSIAQYHTRRRVLDDWKCGGRTQRRRAFTFGSRSPIKRFHVEQHHWPRGKIERAVTSNVRIPQERHFAKAKGKGGVFPGDGVMQEIPVAAELQGLPPDFFEHLPFTATAIRKMLGNGVPLAMGRAIARAVIETLEAA